jgi:hypothetical protein
MILSAEILTYCISVFLTSLMREKQATDASRYGRDCD